MDTGMAMNHRRVELLAPAGSREAFEGALSAGADAVYLGGERFGARAYADNFSTEEIVRAIREAHVLGRRVYLTANVLTRESELGDLVRFVEELHRAGLDGVIVQDIGVLAALREACPGLPLHASTQLSVTSAEAVRYLRRFGVRRVVPARDLELHVFAADEIQYCADLAEVHILFFGPEFIGRIESIEEHLSRGRLLIYVGDGCPTFAESYRELVADCSSKAPLVRLEEEDDAAIYFSSGTTGFPKAILHNHESLMQAAQMEQKLVLIRRVSVGPGA